MKKFGFVVWLLAIIGLGWYTYIEAGSGEMLRVAGSSSRYNQYSMVVDSADRIQVDTCYSDTALVPDTATLCIITPIRDTTIACDSCINAWDSVRFDVCTYDIGGFWKIIATGGFSSDHTRDTATTLRFYVNNPVVVSAGAKDSTLFDRLWIRTRMVDSVRAGILAKDTTLYGIRYFVRWVW